MKTQKILNGAKVIVTGGAGFIGSHWVDYLIANNSQVTVIDNLSRGFFSNLNPKAKFYKADVINYETLYQIFKKAKPDFVYDLAASTDVPRSIREPLFDFLSLRGSLNIIHLSKMFKVKRIFFLSTGFTYGNTAKRPIKESEPFKPLSPYGITKKCVENYLQFYHSVYNLDYVVLRPATIYGPRQVYGAMSDYINSLAKSKQTEIYGNGKKTRDYVYIEDFIGALAGVTATENLEDPIFNVGTARETSLNKLYSTIAKILNKKAKPIYKPDRPGELRFYSCSYSKIHKATGWRPETSLKEGLKKTINWWGYKTQ